MDGTRQANSGNFPLGPDAADLGPVDLKVVMAEARKLANALSARATELGARHLRPAAIAAFLRDVSWRETPSRLQAFARHVVDHRQAILDVILRVVLGQLDERAPAATRRLRIAFPALPWAAQEDEANQPTFLVLAEFDALDPDKKIATARNIALLWDCFVEEFGGVSGFVEAGVAEQTEYLDKLDAAASRMEVGRGTPVAYHYVSVMMIKLYVESFHSGKADRGAIALANHVAALVNQGRIIRAKQSKSPIILVSSNDAPVQKTAPSDIIVDVEREQTVPSAFRIGYVSQPAMRVGF
jgi:hypothetical protein